MKPGITFTINFNAYQTTFKTAPFQEAVLLYGCGSNNHNQTSIHQVHLNIDHQYLKAEDKTGVKLDINHNGIGRAIYEFKDKKIYSLFRDTCCPYILV